MMLEESKVSEPSERPVKKAKVSEPHIPQLSITGSPQGEALPEVSVSRYLRESSDVTASTFRQTGQSPFLRSLLNTSPRTSFPKATFFSKKIREAGLTRLQEKLSKLEQEFKAETSEIPEEPERFEVKEATFVEEEELDLQRPEIPKLRWCAYCRAERRTEVSFVNTSKTLWSAISIFMLGGVLGCFMLPYFTNSCKKAKLKCHNCKHALN